MSCTFFYLECFVNLKKISNRKNQLDDIAILTKSEVLDTDLGMSFENVDIAILGTAKKVIINKDETIIIDGAGDKETIKGRVE